MLYALWRGVRAGRGSAQRIIGRPSCLWPGRGVLAQHQQQRKGRRSGAGGPVVAVLLCCCGRLLLVTLAHPACGNNVRTFAVFIGQRELLFSAAEVETCL